MFRIKCPDVSSEYKNIIESPHSTEYPRSRSPLRKIEISINLLYIDKKRDTISSNEVDNDVEDDCLVVVVLGTGHEGSVALKKEGSGHLSNQDYWLAFLVNYFDPSRILTFLLSSSILSTYLIIMSCPIMFLKAVFV